MSLGVQWLSGLELPDRKLGDGDVTQALFGVRTRMIRGAQDWWRGKSRKNLGKKQTTAARQWEKKESFSDLRSVNRNHAVLSSGDRTV